MAGTVCLAELCTRPNFVNIEYMICIFRYFKKTKKRGSKSTLTVTFLHDC